jgi:hypothetical protein
MECSYSTCNPNITSISGVKTVQLVLQWPVDLMAMVQFPAGARLFSFLLHPISYLIGQIKVTN